MHAQALVRAVEREGAHTAGHRIGLRQVERGQAIEGGVRLLHILPFGEIAHGQFVAA